MSLLKRSLPERLIPLAAGHGLQPFYGDLHNHCALSYGHGSLEQALARAGRQLDFVSVTGHAHWPDMPTGDPRVAHIVDFHVEGFARLNRLWPGHFQTLRAADVPGSLTVFPGYEIHSCEFGDLTILVRDLDPADLVLADSPAELRAALAARHGDRAMAFPHHLAYRRGARGVNWEAFDPRLSPVVEIVSMHGLSEASMGERPFLHSMGPGDGRSTVEHGLGLGHVFGFIGNTDHHSGYPGSYGHGRSVIYAPENGRAALWDALRARRTGALTGDRAHLFFTVDGTPPGGVTGPTRAAVRIEAVGGSFIDAIDLVRGGRVVERITPEITPSPVDASGAAMETLLVLELGWGARGTGHQWTGELRLEGGEILSVEPRLRGPEVVSPLEGAATDADSDSVEAEDGVIRFRVRAEANPNNATPATQAIAARVRIAPEARIHAVFDGQKVTVPAARLLEGALSGNLGPIDSPAWRLHRLPRPEEWQWAGTREIAPLAPGDWVYARMRQKNGQWAWTSPVYCR
jgi:hypothetical protein